MAYVHNENHAKQNGPFPTTLGLRSPVIQKIFEMKSDTSIVACVNGVVSRQKRGARICGSDCERIRLAARFALFPYSTGHLIILRASV